MKKSENRKPLVILVSLIVIITVLHYSTDPATFYFHEIYKLLYYIPIILAGFYFGIKGGLISSIAVSTVYLPHVIFQWHGTEEDFIHRALETVVYVVIGFIVGKLAQSEHAQKDRYEQAALELETSYQKLKHQSEMISEVEDQLRHSERLSVMGELAASLAHEVRT